MTSFRGLNCAIVAILLASGAFAQETAKEMKLLDGVWTPTAAELGGQAWTEAQLKIMKLEVAGEKYTVTVGKTVDMGTVKLDLSKKPRAMDIIGNDGPNKDKTFLAIYELNGDTLRVCYDLTGKSRPTEFKTQKDALVFLVTYQRGKP